MNDIVLNKKENIERCIKLIRTYYSQPGDEPFEADFRLQDAISLNLVRAVEQCISLANYTIKTRKLGLPKETRESFRLLVQDGIIPPDLGEKLEGMIGLRNTLIHQYQEVDLQLMIDVVENHLDDLIDFTNYILQEFGRQA